jgi:hypothetical protein
LNRKAGWYADFQDWMGQNSDYQDIEQFNVPVYLPTLKIENDVFLAASVSAVQAFLGFVKIDNETILKGIHENLADLIKAPADGALLSFSWIIGLARAM